MGTLIEIGEDQPLQEAAEVHLKKMNRETGDSRQVPNQGQEQKIVADDILLRTKLEMDRINTGVFLLRHTGTEQGLL